MSEFVSGSDRLAASDLTAHAAFLERLARSVVGDVHLAQDLVQETLTIIVEGRSQPPEGASLRAWLAGILKNRARMSLRSSERRTRREREVARPEELDRHVASPDEFAARLETQESLLRAVRALPQPYRDIIVRRFYEGRSIAEIAELTETSVSTLRTRLSRALALLRDDLDRTTNGDRAAWCAALLGLPTSSVRLVKPPGPGALTAPSVATATGVAAMLSKKTVAVGAVLFLCAMTAALVVVTSDNDTSQADAEFAAETATTDNEPGRNRVAAGATAPTPATTTDADTTTAINTDDPIALRSIDRDRDLHGLVTDPGGLPIEGATVEATRRVWGRTGIFNAAGASDVEHVADEVTGKDGAFALRLHSGTVADLVVRADGFAEARFTNRSAGERFDVVLRPGASLAVRVVDEADQPVAGVTAIAWRFRSGAQPVFNRRAQTDAEGHAQFDGLSAGRALVRAESAELGCPAEARVLLTGGGTHTATVRLVRGRTLVGAVVDLDSREPIAGAQIGEGWQQRRAVVTDSEGLFELPGYAGRSGAEVHVTAEGYGRSLQIPQDDQPLVFGLRRGDTLVGRVLDSDGAPLPDARVTAFAYEGRNDGDALDTVSQRSALDGSFTLRGLRRDLAHTLIVQSPGRGILRIPVSPRAEGPGVISMGDIRMRAGLAISGRVSTTGESAGVAGALVELDPLSPTAADFSYGTGEERHTDDLGRFRFADLSPDRYRLSVRRSGFPSGTADVVRDVELTAAGNLAPVVLELPKAHELTVTVHDRAGAAVSGVGLVVASREHLVETRTDAQGRGSLSSPLPPPWTLIVHAPRGSGSGRRYLDQTVEEVDPAEGPIAIVIEEAAIIRGRVLDTDRTPLPRVYVTALRQDGTQAGEEAVSDATGAFSLSVPAAGAYRVVADGRQQLPESWIYIETLPIRAERDGVPAPADDIELLMEAVPADRSLNVAVTTPDGRPLAGALVVVTTRVGGARPPADAPRQATDARGIAAFHGLRGQRQRVAIDHTAATRSSGAIVRPDLQSVIPAGQTIEVAFRAGEPLTGRVDGPDGQPLPNVHAQLLTANGVLLGTHVTGEDGRFAFLGLAGHGHQVSVAMQRPGEPRRFDVIRNVKPALDLVFVLE